MATYSKAFAWARRLKAAQYRARKRVLLSDAKALPSASSADTVTQPKPPTLGKTLGETAKGCVGELHISLERMVPMSTISPAQSINTHRRQKGVHMAGYENEAWENACMIEAELLSDYHEAGRVVRGLKLAQNGMVTFAPHENPLAYAVVKSGSVFYEISHDLQCECKDFHTEAARACKHIIAALITEKAMAALAPPKDSNEDLPWEPEPPADDALRSVEENPTPEPASAPMPEDLSILDVPEMPAPLVVDTPAPPPSVSIENPAGYNLKARVGNIEHWYTLHEANDERLIARLKVVVPAFYEIVRRCEEEEQAKRQHPPQAPIHGTGTLPSSTQNGTKPQPPLAGNDTDRSWCPHHEVHMEWHPANERGPGWYSHRLGSGGFCRGGN